MPEYPHLVNAPIVEAVIDIRIEPPADASWDSDESRFSSLRSGYTNSEPIDRFELSTMFAPGVPPTQAVRVDAPAGFRFWNDSEVLQLRFDGLTYSKLTPYTSWDEVFAKAWGAWIVFRDLQPGSVSRIATRFINRIVCTPDRSVEHYIRLMPNLPPEVPGGIRSLFCSHDLIFSDTTGARVIQAIEPQMTESLAYIIDIDVFRDGSFDSSDPLIESSLHELRNLKNQIFFTCVTEAAIEEWQ